MGSIWLHDLDTILLPGVGHGIVSLEALDGWETRGRASGGFDEVNGVLEHHTASNSSWNWDRDIAYIAYGNPYAPSPISTLYIDRRGWVCIIAAGAGNHGGQGGSYEPGGPTYVDINRANQDLIGKEMGNTGVGEVWPWQQIMASLTVDALLAKAFKWGPERFFAHKEYCGPGTTTPGRKIDPFGRWEDHPEQFWPNGTSWGGQQGDIDLYRSLIVKKIKELEPDQKPPQPPEEEEVELIEVICKEANARFLGYRIRQTTTASDGSHVRTFVPWIEWVNGEDPLQLARYEAYKNMGIPSQEFNPPDFTGMCLMGPVPTGDALKTWSRSDFGNVLL